MWVRSVEKRDTRRRRRGRKLCLWFSVLRQGRIQRRLPCACQFYSLGIFSCFVLFGVVVAVAERLVLRLAATAKCNTVAGFISLPVGRFDCDAAANPDRSAHAYLRVFNQSD